MPWDCSLGTHCQQPTDWYASAAHVRRLAGHHMSHNVFQRPDVNLQQVQLTYTATVQDKRTA